MSPRVRTGLREQNENIVNRRGLSRSDQMPIAAEKTRSLARCDPSKRATNTVVVGGHLLRPEYALQFARVVVDRLHIIGGDLQQSAQILVEQADDAQRRYAGRAQFDLPPEMTSSVLTAIARSRVRRSSRINLTNNLVFWQNRFGHANRDHRALLEAGAEPIQKWILHYQRAVRSLTCSTRSKSLRLPGRIEFERNYRQRPPCHPPAVASIKWISRWCL